MNAIGATRYKTAGTAEVNTAEAGTAAMGSGTSLGKGSARTGRKFCERDSFTINGLYVKFKIARSAHATRHVHVCACSASEAPQLLLLAIFYGMISAAARIE